jgi:type II secretory pathway pseudopilin PulG
MKHLTATFLRWPVLWLPLVGAAYSRARESTCDRHGRACCATPQGAVRSMAALAAGSRRWEALDLAAYGRQVQHSSGFWMSFHELTSGYPWITKRALRLAEASARMPGRNAFAYVPALFVPYAGRLGGGFGLLVMVYIVGVLAAIAIPSYQDYIVRAKVTAALSDAAGARTALSEYYATNKKIPESLEAAGVPPLLAGGGRLSLDRNNMALTVSVGSGELILTPRTDAKDHIVWTCTHGGNLKPMQVPPSCRGN